MPDVIGFVNVSFNMFDSVGAVAQITVTIRNPYSMVYTNHDRHDHEKSENLNKKETNTISLNGCV